MPINRRHGRHLAPRTLVLAAVTCLALAAASAPASMAAAPSVDGEIVIRYAPGTTPGERAAVHRSQGLTPVHAAPNGRTEVVTAPGRSTTTVRRELSADPHVEAVAPNHVRDLAADPAAEPAFGNLWALSNAGQTLYGTTTATGVANVDIDGLEALRSGLGDPNVVVAVVDDGVDLGHPDLAAAAWTNPGEAGAKAANGIDDDQNGYVDDVHGWDFCNGDNTTHDAGMDGHGTHVAGTIAASLNGQGIVGVAPGVRIMALKFIDDGATCGSDDLAVEAIDYAASFGVRIINASWGGPLPSSVLDAAIAESGALVMAAAGNGGADLDLTPALKFYPASSLLPNIVAVTAIDQSGRLAPFANYGTTTVDLAAPGTNVLSTYPADAECPAPCYAWSEGTSMAAPHVSGVAALVASRQPSLLADPLALRARLLATGRSLSGLAGKTVNGRLVNALRAIDPVGPTVRAPDRFGFRAGSVIGSRSIATYVGWPTATDTGSGVWRYRLRRLGPDGWTDVVKSTSTLSAKSSLRYGSAYTFRLRATDRAGNVSASADSPPVVPTLHADSTKLARYGPNWTVRSSASSTGGKLHSATRRGSWMTFSFNGRSVAVVAPKGASRGSVRVYVDGVYASTVSLYRSTYLAKVVVFARAWPTKGPHTVRLVVVGTAGHPRVDVDGFVVIR